MYLSEHPFHALQKNFTSDTLSLPFVVSSIFLFFKLKEASFKKQKLIYSFLTGAILSFGILLKGSIYILLVAIIIYFILTLKNWSQIIVLGIMLITLGSSNIMWHQYINHCNWIDNSVKNELELPATHWIMMASIGNGGFRQEDLDYTLSFPDKDTKKTATIEKTLERIRGYKSLTNYLNFEFKKIGQSLADGKFIQNGHLLWYKTRTWIYDYVLVDGLHYNTCYYYIIIFYCINISSYISFLFN